MLDWLVIGGGPHGVHVAARLLGEADVPRDKVRILDDEDVLHFIDNSSALYGMVKGYSSRPDSMAIIRAFHAANLALRANVYFSYVASKACGDAPKGSDDDM